MYELIKSTLFLTGLLMIILGLILLLPKYIDFQFLMEALTGAIR